MRRIALLDPVTRLRESLASLQGPGGRGCGDLNLGRGEARRAVPALSVRDKLK